jgi:RNA polymerase sigma-70 factor (ECF subfamily)
MGPNFGADTVRYVYAIAMKYVRDEDAAWDVTQDALLNAFRHRASFRGDSAYSTWLYRIAATAALMYLRKQRRRSREVLASTPVDPDAASVLDAAASPGPSPEATVGVRQEVERVRSAVAALGEKYEPVFWMRYGDGYSETEIADLLETTLPTVKTRAHRALVAARTKLAA